MKRLRYRNILAAAALVGALLAAVPTYVAAREDPQGEFDHDEGHLSGVALALQVFAPWFVIPFAIISAGGVIARRLGTDRES